MNANTSLITKGIWLYLLLIIFEGGLRKWVLPGLAAPLLIIRDPVAIWILFIAWRDGFFPKSNYIIGMSVVGVLGIFTALLFGHGSLPVAIFGARILLIHFPLIFVIGKVLNQEDVIKIGRLILYLSIPIALLTILQFYSPQSAWVNRGVGGDVEGAGFQGALGFSRPPGTFSFTNGNTLYFGLVASFLVYFWLNPKKISLAILIFSSLGLLIEIPLSISRTLFFTILVCLAFGAFGALRNGKYVGKMIMAFFMIVFALIVLSQVGFFQTAIAAFTDRFDTAGRAEGGIGGTLVDRYLGGLIKTLESSAEQSFFGYGMGMGTSVGSKLLTGKVSYLIAEDEWGRLIGEMGPVMGLSVIIIRLALSAKLFYFCYRKLVTGDILPWVLLSFGLLIIPQGQWSQPTALGFAVISGGLIIASLKGNIDNKI